MTIRSWAVLAVVVTGCSGSAGRVTPAPEAEQALRNFMQAAADSNFTAMAEQWGTARGSAGATGSPADYQQRMVIVQAYLRGVRYRILSNEAVQGASNQRLLQVEIARDDCVRLVPFTMVRTSGGNWVVNQFDLEKVGSPTRGCDPAARPGN